MSLLGEPFLATPGSFAAPHLQMEKVPNEAKF